MKIYHTTAILCMLQEIFDMRALILHTLNQMPMMRLFSLHTPLPGHWAEFRAGYATTQHQAPLLLATTSHVPNRLIAICVRLPLIVMIRTLHFSLLMYSQSFLPPSLDLLLLSYSIVHCT